jgi:hypothetical protein
MAGRAGKSGCEVIDKSDAENRLRFEGQRKGGMTIVAKLGTRGVNLQ